jgi:hypothetical protein
MGQLLRLTHFHLLDKSNRVALSVTKPSFRVGNQEKDSPKGFTLIKKFGIIHLLSAR